MKVFVNKQILEKATGCQITGFYISTIISFASQSKIATSEFLLDPDFYYGIAIALISSPGVLSGKDQESDLPYFVVAGIKFQMISYIDADKYLALL